MNSNHTLVKIVNDVTSNTAPSIHPNQKNHPVPLPFRGMVISLLGSLISSVQSNQNSPEKISKSVQTLAEINGLIEAAINIHRNIHQKSENLSQQISAQEQKFLLKINKLAVLVGDYCLARACELLANLNNPEAVYQIANTLSEISANSSVGEEHSNLLLASCCETIFIVDENSKNSENSRSDLLVSQEQVKNFAKNLGQAHLSLLDDNLQSAYQHKQLCLEFLDNFDDNLINVETLEYKKLLQHLIEAFLPIENDAY